MKRIIKILHIDRLGLLEIMMALFPIVVGYTYGVIKMSVVWLLLMDILSFTRKREHQKNNLLIVVFSFVLLHEVMVLFITGMPQVHLNYIFVMAITLLSLFIITPSLQYDRFVGSLYLIGYISCVGIIIQFLQMLAGQVITPIPLPFLPRPDISSRLFEEGNRPCSFFWEPASYVTYMMVPFFHTLVKREWPIMVFFLFCIFLSTSTNGIVLAPIMISVYVLMGSQKTHNKIFMALLLFGAVYFLFNSDLFEVGVKKMEETELDNNARISNGPRLIEQMPFEHIIFGYPAHTVVDYHNMGYVSEIYVNSFDGYYMSDFWRVLASYGIFGLILHLMVYFWCARQDKTLWPYITVLLVAQFSQSVAFASIYVFQLCFLLCYIRNNKHLSNNEFKA